MDKWIEQYCNYMFPIEATEKEMENAKKLQAENMPEFLYVFKSYNKHTLKILNENKIWCARTDTLNDPFECAIKCCFKDDVFNEMKSSYFRGKDDAVISSFADFETAARDYNQSVVEREHTYTFSLTTTFQPPSLWWHYANKYRGVCIEYKKSDLMKEKRIWNNLHPVMYTDKIFDIRPYIDKSVKNQNINMLVRLALNKNVCWSYESEMRIVLKGDPKTCGKGIILSAPKPSAVYVFEDKMKKSEFVRLKKVLNKRNISLYILQAKDNDFGFNRVLDTRKIK